MRILTVSSVKGGVGKTTFAINFALDLSRYRKTLDVTIEQNFNSFSERTQYLLGGRRSSDFGEIRLFKEDEILDALLQRGR